MGNPLFGNSGFGGGPQGSMPNNPFGMFGNMMNFMNQFNQFRSGFQGNPEQMVQQLRQNGQMTDEQFNQLSGMAQSILPFIRR